MARGAVRISMLADASGVRSGTKDAERHISRLESSASRSFGAMKTAALGFGAVVGGAAVLGMKQAVGAASDLEEQLGKSRVVFKGASDEVVAFSKTSATSIGISQRAALEATGTFGNMLVPMGIARDRAGEMSTRMVKLAGDMASFNNASPEETLEAIRSGLSGEQEPLRKFGVFLNEATIRQEALNLGLVKGKEELTAAAKAQAVYSVILKQTKDAQGDYARTSGSLANQQRTLAAQWENVSAKLGMALMPALADLMAFVNRNMPQIERAFMRVRDTISGVVEFVRAVIRDDWDKAMDLLGRGADKAMTLFLRIMRAAIPKLARFAYELGARLVAELAKGVDAGLARVPGSGALRRLLGFGPAGNTETLVLPIIIRVNTQLDSASSRILGGVGDFSATFGGRRASGGYVPGDPSAGDVVPILATGGEVVLNEGQQSMLGRSRIMEVLRRTGGVLGGRRFQRGGVVAGAQRFAEQQVGEPYVWGGGHSLGDSYGWDCSGFATNVAARVPGYKGGINTTMGLWGKMRRASGTEPVVFGFSGMETSDPRKQHMGIRVNGVWYDAGSGGVQRGRTRWPSGLWIPPGLENLSVGGAVGGGYDMGNPTTREAPPDYSEMDVEAIGGGRFLVNGRRRTPRNAADRRALGNAARRTESRRARDFATGAALSGPVPRRGRTLSEVIEGRHRDDSLQDERTGDDVERQWRAGGVTNDAYISLRREEAINKVRTDELKADREDTLSELKRIQRRRVARQGQLRKMLGQLVRARRPEVRRAILERMAQARQDIAEMWDTIIDLQRDIADIDQQLAELGYRASEITDELTRTPTTDSDATTASTSTDPTTAAELDRSNAQLAAARNSATLADEFIRTAFGPGDLGPGAGSAIGAASGGRWVPIRVEADSFSAAALSAFGHQGYVGASFVPSGA
ncbi:MAG TPA: hypothetical protein VNT51_05885 [Miltoncostaeaceae bacterium]|nr:hypothetical protein [Miltoncostaeaceae bacterium]